VLNEKKHLASLLVAQDRLSNKEMAAKLGVAVRTLDNWKTDPEFKAAVEAHLQAWMAKVQAKGIADRRRRIFQLNERWRKAQAIVEARAKDPGTARLPGGRTGFLVRHFRSLPKGDGERVIIEEAVFDAKLFIGLLKIEAQAARELGQWDEKPERVVRRLADLTREEIDSVLADWERSHTLAPPDPPNDGNPTVVN
jgi:hypothetical protein